MVVVWPDGRKERAVEDYPPWSYVAEIWDGYLDLDAGPGEESFRYDVAWVPADLAPRERHRLGITQDDF